MKNTKKIVALLLAVLMLAVSVSAFAEPATPKTYTITITAPTGHTYEIYQVFTGEADGTTLTSLKYGKNAKTGTEGDAVSQEDMTAFAAFAEKTYNNDQAKIDDLEEYVTLSNPIAEVTSGTATAGLATGYYVIIDKENTAPDGEGETLYMFKVLSENLSISAKSDKPSSEKKVKDILDTTPTETDWQDSADYEIGDTIPYQLTFTLPSDYANYEHYYVLFKDTISSGLTLNTGSVKIQYGSGTATTIEFKSETASGGTLYTYEIMDLKASQPSLVAGDVITITYTAYLNDEAVLGNPGNPNTYNVEFSRNPNNTGNGTSKPDDTTETPEDVNVVFTYKTVFDKVDEDNNPLEGADFTLYKNVNGTFVDVTTLGDTTHPGKDSSSGTSFSFTGLDDGEYKLVETKTPKGYNPIEDVVFTIEANHVTSGDDLTTLILNSLQATGGLTITGDTATGTLTTSIENKSGVTLPTTGGMGTTIFYVGGSALALIAVVLLISKRRVNAK